MISNIVNLTSGIVTIITFFITFYPEYFKNDKIKDYLQDSFPYFIFLYFCWLFYQYYIKKKLLNAGVNGVPIKLTYYLKRFNPFLLLYFSQDIHGFHHSICEAKNTINTSKIVSPLSKEGKILTAHLLQKCQIILQKTLGEDFSLNIKLFEKKVNSDSSNLSDIRDAVLLTYERVPSKKEREKELSHIIKKRSNSEKFVISKWEPDKINKLYSIIDSYNGTYKKNLAYDFVFSANNHFWLSNDLEKDKKQMLFTSISDNYLDYYKSLAVFLLSPPLNVGEHVDVENVLGLIIFDTIETNVFHTEYSKQILGYFSHLIYDYFLTYEVFKN